MTLQLCAILSQASQHEDALELSKVADGHSASMVALLQRLCKLYSDITMETASSDDYTPTVSSKAIRVSSCINMRKERSSKRSKESSFASSGKD